MAAIVALSAVLFVTQTQARPFDIVAFGDSNTAGDGVGRNFAWPALIEKELRARGHDVRIRNAGSSGDTTAEGLARLDRSVPEGTDAAIVFLGRNDMRFRTPGERTAANIDAIVARLRQRGIAVLLIGFRPYDFSAIAAAHGAGYYPDFFAGVARNGRKLRRYVLPLDLFRHLNPAGHAAVAKRLLPSVEALVAGAGG